MRNMTFIYWCVNSDGVVTNFKSGAYLEIGMNVSDKYGETARIIEMDVIKDLYSARDFAEEYDLNYLMSV